MLSLKIPKWWPGAELNHRRKDFQSFALPLSYQATFFDKMYSSEVHAEWQAIVFYDFLRLK